MSHLWFWWFLVLSSHFSKELEQETWQASSLYRNTGTKERGLPEIAASAFGIATKCAPSTVHL